MIGSADHCDRYYSLEGFRDGKRRNISLARMVDH
jgi:hypothetical protein